MLPTKVVCEITGCVHNSSCCMDPNRLEDTFTYCKADSITIGIDEDTDYGLQCSKYKWDNNKKFECDDCQISKYGALSINEDKLFEVDTPLDLL